MENFQKNTGKLSEEDLWLRLNHQPEVADCQSFNADVLFLLLFWDALLMKQQVSRLMPLFVFWEGKASSESPILVNM